MDTLEITRRTAEDLHFAAVQRGADPQRPYDFVRNEARRRSIEVEKLPKDDARLRGDRKSVV